MKRRSLLKMVLWIGVATACFFYATILASNLILGYLGSDPINENWLFHLKIAICGLTFVLIAIAVLIDRLCTKYNIDAGHKMRSIVLAVLVFGIFWIVRDEAPVQRKYDWDSLPVPKQFAEESYALAFGQLGSNNKKAKVSFTDINLAEMRKDPRVHESAILSKWEKLEFQRGIIKQLNKYQEIADLSRIENYEDYVLNDLGNLVFMARIYGVYARLQTEKGNAKLGARSLIELHSVARKALPYARFLINRILLGEALRQNMETVHWMVLHARTGPETLQLLSDGFAPLTHEEIDYQSIYISEAIFADHYFSSIEDMKDVLRSWESGFALIPDESSWDRTLLGILTPILVQKQSTMNTHLKIYDLLIEGAQAHPPDFRSFKAFFSKRNRYPIMRNVGGFYFSNASLAHMDSYAHRMGAIKVKSDLLAILLNERLEKEHEITDYYTGKPYPKGIEPPVYKSAGPDKILDTEDDIRL